MLTIASDDQLISGFPDLGKAVNLFPKTNYINTNNMV